MNPAATHCPLPKSAVWRFLSLLFAETPPFRNTETPLPSTFSPPSGPAWAGVAQRSPATGSANGLHRESNFLAISGNSYGMLVKNTH